MHMQEEMKVRRLKTRERMNVLLNPLITDPKTFGSNSIENKRKNNSENENRKLIKMGVKDNLLLEKNQDLQILNDAEFLIKKKKSKKHTRAHIDVGKDNSEISGINVGTIQNEKIGIKNQLSEGKNGNNNFNLLNYQNIVEHLPTVNNYLPSLPFYGKIKSPARAVRGSVSFNFDNHEPPSFSERNEEISADMGVEKKKRVRKIE